MAKKLTKRKAFNFLRSYYDVLNELKDDKDKLNFLLAIIDKQFLDEDPEGLNFVVNLCYESQRHAIESSVNGWKRANKDTPITTLGTTPPTPLGTDPETLPKEEEEEEKEEEELSLPSKPKPEIKTAFENEDQLINWFNRGKKHHTGKAGRTKLLSTTDSNNFKKLNKVYSKTDFYKALESFCKSDYLKTNVQLFTLTHFLRNDNFNKYLESYGEIDKSKIAATIDYC